MLKLAAVLGACLLVLSGCAARADTRRNHQFLEDLAASDGLFLQLGGEANDTWNAYVAGHMPRQQAFDFLTELQDLARREAAVVGVVAANQPQALPGSDYGRLISEVRTASDVLVDACGQLLAALQTEAADHAKAQAMVDKAQQDMIRLPLWVARADKDALHELEVINAYDAKK